MPSIIPSPGSPGTSPNISASVEQTGDLNVAAGQKFYSTTAGVLYNGYGLHNVVNDGVLWSTSATGNASVVSLLSATVDNHGLAVAQSTGGAAITYNYVFDSFQTLTNTGRIFAISSAGAFGIYANNGDHIVNSGLIAAQGNFANAIGVFYETLLQNLAGGQILAEGAQAIAVDIGSGHFLHPEINDVDNAGLIRAASTDPNNASIGIRGAGGSAGLFNVLNSGTITADIAVYIDDNEGSPAQPSINRITNTATGVINGEVFLAGGDDLVINQGHINGYVDLDLGNDVFDNSAGVLVGDAELGQGDDHFIGGAAADASTGGRGDDLLEGGGGADLLLGGRNDDTLYGGAGSDGLYGESGDDRIYSQAGDHIDAGSGDDYVYLGDLTFADADGGDGFDILSLPGSGLVDLQAALATGRIHHFEEIALPGSQGLVVRAADVAGLTGTTTLYVTGGSGAVLDLVGGWASQGQVTAGGVQYLSYALGGATVLVGGPVSVSILAAAPGGAASLGAVAGGPPAPLPGAVAGADLTSSHTFADLFEVRTDLVIDADELWTAATPGHALITDGANLTNYGLIQAVGGASGQAAIAGYYFGAITNEGQVTASASGNAGDMAFNLADLANYPIDFVVANLPGNVNALYVGSLSNAVTNDGLLSASSEASVAIGYNNYFMPGATNTGHITATSSAFVAAGVYAHNGGLLDNSGDITATGQLTAIGVGLSRTFEITNSGHITAVGHDATRPSVGIYIWYQDNDSTITNTGVISGDYAIQATYGQGGDLVIDNQGQLIGKVSLSAVSVHLTNRGLITGDISLGAKDDVFDGHAGVQNGAVYGLDGSDLLLGGSASESLFGGAGDDIVGGGGGNDLLYGGDGFDLADYRFATGGVTVDLALAGSNAVGGGQGSDTLTDFEGLRGGAFGDHLYGSDTANTLYGMDGDDQLFGRGGADILDGGAGNDMLSGEDGADIQMGGAGNDLLYGGAGADQLDGGVGEDSLDGGDGDDRLTGGGDADQLTGGAGADTFLYQQGDGHDVITDFTLGQDVLKVDGSLGYGSAQLLQQGDDTLVVFSGSDSVLLKNVLASAITTADLLLIPAPEPGVTLTGTSQAETLLGGTGDDTLIGLGGDDILRGGGGDDFLDGGDGGDTLDGGAGTDTVTLADAAAFQVISLWQGIVANNIKWDTLISIENAIGSSFGDTIAGDAGVNVLHGGPGEDTIYGLAGNDLLWGDGDNDRIDGGDGWDIALYSVSSGQATWAQNLDGSWTVTAGAEGTDTLRWVEALRFTDRTVILGGAPPTDFNLDGKSDVLWRNDNGEAYVWNSQSGQGAFLGQTLGNPGTGWHVQDVADYSGDGKADILWRNNAGDLYVYKSDAGAAVSFTGQSISFVDPVWAVVPQTGDFNGDGRADILFRNTFTGEVYVWNSQTGSDAVNFLGQSLGAVGLNWSIKGVGDFNADGRADVLWRSDAGDVYVWLDSPTGAPAMSGQTISAVGNDWTILGLGDFNGDGRDDILWRHTDGELYVWNSQTGSAAVNFLGQPLGAVGLDWTVAAIGDYDGDGRADVLFRNADGRVYLWNSNDTGPVGFQGQGLGTTATDWHLLSDFHGM